mmetsp:Transcript_69020/g.225035  ORF Transcript_69020/g.225035 Transcript_69020/m.225035 type:complete len:258 (-) Transcript_69020:87-860(-)
MCGYTSRLALLVVALCLSLSPRVRALKGAEELAMADYPWQTTVQNGVVTDVLYPGTAVDRLRSVLGNVLALGSLDGPWTEVRRQLLAAGGLKDDRSTGHAFNDDNHCDLTTMRSEESFKQNEDGSVAQISRRNQLGPHIQAASLPELGVGGSWSTCTNGAHITPPNDVAHVQFSSRIAFKLVWVPPKFEEFVLVDDEGRELKRGRPTGQVPHISARQSNFALVKGGKYAQAAEAIAAGGGGGDCKQAGGDGSTCAAA